MCGSKKVSTIKHLEDYDKGYKTAKLRALLVVDKVRNDRFRIIEGEVFVSVNDVLAVIQEI